MNASSFIATKMHINAMTSSSCVVDRGASMECHNNVEQYHLAWVEVKHMKDKNRYCRVSIGVRGMEGVHCVGLMELYLLYMMPSIVVILSQNGN